MKKIIITLLVLWFNLTGAGEIVKLNQEKPLNPRAGRELMIKKVLQIGDEKSGFLFGNPMELRAADDGSFYVMEFNKLYKFSAKGKFLKSLCRVGEGPGEVGQLYNFILQDNLLLIFGIMPKKIISLDLAGNYLSEIRVIPSMPSSKLIFCKNKKYYLCHSEIPQIKKNPYFADVNCMISEVSPDGKSYKTSFSFPIKKYVMEFGGGGFKILSIVDTIIEKFQDQFLVINHTPEYLLKVFDLKENKITHIFSRAYKRVEFKDGRWGKDPDAPKLQYENDIKKIFPQEKEIWVLTSAGNEKDGYLIDVFDSTGSYADNFFVRVPGNILYIRNNSIFVSEEDSEYNQLVVQYLIMVK